MFGGGSAERGELASINVRVPGFQRRTLSLSSLTIPLGSSRKKPTPIALASSRLTEDLTGSKGSI